MTLARDLFKDTTLPVLKADHWQTSKLDPSKGDIDFLTKELGAEELQDSKMEIGFYLPTTMSRVILRNMASITLGRSDKERNVMPTVDLTDENALFLGVSRLHAKILYADGQFYLKDLGSTNGTWVNQDRLEAYGIVPIERGDTIRLGALAINIL